MTNGATRSITQDFFAASNVKKILVTGKKPCKNIIQGGGVFGKSWFTKEQRSSDCLLQGLFDRLCHYQRMSNTLTEAEQKVWGEVAEKLLQSIFGTDFRVTKKMLDSKSPRVLPCVSNATNKKRKKSIGMGISKAYQNKSEEEKQRLRTNKAIAAARSNGNTNPEVWWKCMNDGRNGEAGRCTFITKDGKVLVGNVIQRPFPSCTRPQLRCSWCKTRDGLTQAKRECDTGLTRSRKGHFGFLRCSCPQCDGKEGNWISDECRKRMEEERGGEGEEE